MHKEIVFLILGIIFCTAQSSPVEPTKEQPSATNCGYDSCHSTKDGYVNVHIISHSHDDVGWLKTVDQYYYGSKTNINRAGVRYIYDNVLKAVQKNTDRKFIYVETAFFWKWWSEQEEEDKTALRDLVNNGQIEFISGGWSMNDEAVTNYQSIIDNMAWGLKILNETFGECARPKMGWQIDPFGHSSEMASIFASLGFDGVILGRIDAQDQAARRSNRSMDMVWRGNNNLGRSSDIFTSILNSMYGSPGGYCFDLLCDDDVLVDEINSTEYNVDGRARDFISYYAKDEPKYFQTSNLIITMGNDFAYQEAEKWFTNIDKLIKYINAQEEFDGVKYNVFYSTPSCYAAAVHKESNGILTSPLKTDDFLPYAHAPHAYWTGFYTSRSTLKRFERIGNNFLQICKQLYTVANIPSENEPKLTNLREAMGVVQHHDAITGTEKEAVSYDYARLLDVGIKNCEDITNQALSALTNVVPGNFETCLLVNISQCAFSENADVFVVTVYNPLSRNISKHVRLPVFGTSYNVTDPNGDQVTTQIIPVSQAVQNIIGRESNATLELIFEANNIPPLGYKSFYVEKSTGDHVTKKYAGNTYHYSAGEGIGFSIDPSTGFLTNLELDDYSLDVDQKFWFYNGTNGKQDDSGASGAYVFRPDTEHPIALVSDSATYEVYQGNLVIEVQQSFNEFVSQTLRIYENEKFVELDWVVGPLAFPLNESSPNEFGKEVISRFSTALNSDSTFYTDSNGRSMLQRIRNFRPTWSVTINESESGNYYPVTSRILIQDVDEDLQFAVLTDRAQGGSSLQDGDVELMLLRNTVADDQLGVAEPLQEKAFDNPIVVRGSHYAVFGPITEATQSGDTIAAIQKEIAERKLLDSWIFLSSPAESSFDEYSAQHPMQFSGLSNALPQNVHILTLEPWTDKHFLLRLEHTFEVNEDPVLSQAASVDLDGIFTTFEIISLRETTLGGNQWLEDNQRLNFTSAYQSDESQKDETLKLKESAVDLTVSLQPMQIRTFVIEVNAKTQ